MVHLDIILGLMIACIVLGFLLWDERCINRDLRARVEEWELGDYELEHNWEDEEVDDYGS